MAVFQMLRQVVDQELLNAIPGHTVRGFKFLADLAVVAQGFKLDQEGVEAQLMDAAIGADQ